MYQPTYMIGSNYEIENAREEKKIKNSGWKGQTFLSLIIKDNQHSHGLN